MQNWCCGYYLLYFAPFVPLFALHRMWTLGRCHATRTRTWAGLMAAAAGTLVLTLPFLFPYQAAQQLFGFERPFGEVVLFSANVWSYITASENVGCGARHFASIRMEKARRSWGLSRGFSQALRRGGFDKAGVLQTDASMPSVSAVAYRYVTVFLVLAVVTQLIAVLSVVLFGGFDDSRRPISARTPQRLLMQFVVAFAVAARRVAASPRRSCRLLRSPIAFAFAATVVAMWLSLGPLPNAGDARVSGFGLYGLLYDYVPGFNGVRVPARYAMIAGLFLAILAGYGWQRLRRVPRPDSRIARCLHSLRPVS